jgi:putative membrane protein
MAAVTAPMIGIEPLIVSNHFMGRLFMALRKTLYFGLAAGLVSIFGFYPLTAARAQQGRYYGWDMGPGMMGGWGTGWFGGIFMIVFWILILVGLVFLIRWLIQATSKAGSGGRSGSRAIDILKERYARGEIDKAQFDDMKRDLEG